jgi:hypothetical protein
MIPSDYRLEQVVARLIERLEGARPSFPDDPERAAAAFRRTAEEHVEAAIAEFSEVSLTQDPDLHAAFLRREVLETFLPRYHRLATDMTRREERGFGFGPLADPLGRLGLAGFSLLFLWFVLVRLAWLPVIWPLVLLDLSLVFWPDLAASAHRRWYANRLHRVVADMARIQEQSNAYAPPERLRAPETAPRTRPQPRDKEHT